MAFKARKLKGGFFEILGLEKFLREKIDDAARWPPAAASKRRRRKFSRCAR